jgi:hypothetical protein
MQRFNSADLSFDLSPPPAGTTGVWRCEGGVKPPQSKAQTFGPRTGVSTFFIPAAGSKAHDCPCFVSVVMSLCDTRKA